MKAQRSAFSAEMELLHKGKGLSRTSRIVTFRPFIDDNGLLRVGGRLGLGKLSFAGRYPMILLRDHRMVELLIMHKHLRFAPCRAHTGVSVSRLAILYCTRTSYNTRQIRDCVICKRIEVRPKPKLLRQLPLTRLKPGDVFCTIGVDYAGPIYIKSGPVRKPIITKCYLEVFASLSVKAVHLELVTELTTSEFIATLRRLIARRGISSIMWERQWNELRRRRQRNQNNWLARSWHIWSLFSPR